MNIGNIKFSLGNIRLPLYGLPKPDWHIFVITPYFKELVQRQDFIGNASTIYGVGKTAAAAYNFGSNMLHGDVNVEDGLTTATGIMGFMSGMMVTTKFMTIVFPRAHWLRSYLFFGVQPQRFKGFTHYVNPIYDSDEDSFMRYAISPSEFILYGLNVHSCCDGEVVEVRDEVQDTCREDNIRFGSYNVEEHLGNIIRINHGVVQLTYGSLMRNSTRVKVGDKVRKGDVIAKVGSSGYMKVPFLYLGISYIGPKIPIAGNLGAAFRHEAIFWDSHYQAPLLNSEEFGTPVYKSHTEVFKNIDPYHIQYTKKAATRIPDAALVRRFDPAFPIRDF